MTQLRSRHKDVILLRLINRYLKAGVCINGMKQASLKGVPQGGPLSPVLSNIVLNNLDWELEKRNLRFATMLMTLWSSSVAKQQANA